MQPRSKNITIHDGTVQRSDRERLLGQRGCVLWFTGLSGSGKSTIACAAEALLTEQGRIVQVLDGDNVRHGLNSDLGFSDADRTENIRRISEVAALSAEVGLIVMTAFISPFRADRDKAREIIGSDRFIEVFVDAPLEACEGRDPKGLYKKARAGQIPEFTGISSPYEEPKSPELVVPTAEQSLEQSAGLVVEHLTAGGFLAPPADSSAS